MSKNQVKLVVLDAGTGRQRWSLTVADSADQPLSEGSSRRLTGATPSYAEGILVCPTSLRAVVAVNIAARAFAWGFQYPASQPEPSSRENWLDGAATLADGHVVFQPRTGELCCLNLTSGELVWRRRQADLVYLACVVDGACLLVGEHRFTAVDLRSGQPCWEESPFVAIPAGGMPCGRGFCSGQFYYLPTTDPELLQINVRTGSVARRLQVARELGNLVFCRDFLLSQNAAALTIYPQKEMPPAAAATPCFEADPQQLAARPTADLLGLLGHDRFQVREAASRMILSRQREAMGALAAASRSTDPEVSHRATSFLIHHLHSADAEISFHAHQALLSASPGETSNGFARAPWSENSGCGRSPRLGGSKNSAPRSSRTARP